MLLNNISFKRESLRCSQTLSLWFLLDELGIFSGAPNDGFLLKTLKHLSGYMQSTFGSLEMHSKWRYKICICSVIPGELESFRNYKGFSIIFLNILDAIQRITEVMIFLMLPPSHFRILKC